MSEMDWSGLRPPRAPEHLRRQVVESCRRSAALERAHWLDRLWASRPARWAWVLGVVALLWANARLGLPSGMGHDGNEGREDAAWVFDDPVLAGLRFRYSRGNENLPPGDFGARHGFSEEFDL